MGEIKNSELFQRLKVYFLDMLQSSAGGPGPYSPTPHGLQSAHHTGSIADSQATQFLKTDGTRQLVGSLGVAAGVLIDGVDISEFKNTYDAHALGAAAIAHNGVGVHNHQVDVGGGQLDHGLALSGLSDDDHTQYAMADGSGTRSAYMAERLNKSVIAGNGLTGGGTLTSNITLSADADDGIDVGISGISVDCTDLLGDGITEDASNNFMVDTAFDFDWTGAHTFSSAVNLFGQTTAQHILPRYTDTYDLGSSTMLWRKGWLSELDTILFAQNAVTLLGGWLLISKDEGALVTDVTAADTQIDFGKAMTPNDFVLFRTALKVEYMQVGALVSGTTYNVTRDLDGSGANDWAGGTPFCVLGASGNGRIELNAYNTPRISMLTQGATYNAQTELIRLGDLNGNWGYSAATYGLAIGEYASGKVNMTLDPTNSLLVRTYATTQFSVTPNLLKFGSNVSAAATTGISIFGADQTYNGEIMGNGDLLIGDNSASKANILWDKSAGQLLFRGGTTTQSYIDADGTFVAGPVKINSNGIRMPYSAVDPPGDYCYGIWSGSTPYLRIYSYGATPYINSYTSVAYIQAIDTIDAGSSLFLIAKDINTNVKLSIIISTLGDRYIQSNAKFLINANSTTALLVEQDGVKDNVLVVDTTNARVGVNKAPGYPLDVYGNCRISGSADINLLLERTNNSKAVSLTFNPTGSLGSSNKQWFFRLWPNTSNIHMCTYDGTTIGYVLSLMADGKVGICDTSPAEVLDVNGNINTTGVIKIDDVQVLSNRYIDSKINNNPGNTYDNPTKNLISCIKATLLAHGLVAAS